MHVLLIEPNRLLAKTYIRALEAANYSVSVTGRAQDAVDHVDQKMPSVILLELQLSGHSGVEFLYEFRSYPEWANVPIIIHTIVPPDHIRVDQKQLDRLGVIDYLYKPATSLQKLVRAIENIPQPAL